MRSMNPLDNGTLDKKLTELTKEIRFYNQLKLLSLAWDVDLLKLKDVRKLLAEMSGNRIGLIKERYNEQKDQDTVQPEGIPDE